MPAQPQLRKLLPVLVGTAAVAAFLPALHGEFVAWDDTGNILSNPHFRGLGWDNVRWAFTTLYLGPYQPLAWLSFGLDWTLWRLNPVGYHQTNILLHAGSAVLLYFCCLRLLAPKDAPSLRSGAGREERLPWAAAFAALFWAVHPLRVESVAWVTERRDVLCGVFYLLALLLYLRGEARWKCVTAFCLALLSKGLAFTLPLTLLCVDYHRERRLFLKEKWPYLLPAAAAVALGLVGQGRAAERLTWAEHGLLARGVQSLYGLWFYMEKTLLPLGLSPLYELPRPFPSASPRFVLGALAAAVAAAAAWRRPAWRAAFAHYALTLAPVLGFFQAGPQLAADRFCYLASLSLAALGGAVVLRLPERALPAAAAVLLACAGMSWAQCGVWADSLSLWSRAAAVDPGSAMARESLGTELVKRGRLEEGTSELRAALALAPRSVHALNNLAGALSLAGDAEEAVGLYRRALERDPGNKFLRYNLEAELQRLKASGAASKTRRR